MTELDYACLQLSIAMRNPRAIERKLITDAEKIAKASELWREMSKTSTYTRKLKNLSRH